MILPALKKQQVCIVNWDFIHQYLPLYQKAAVLTLQIGVLGILASIAIGIVCTMVQYFKVPFVRKAVSVYVEISRNTPLLIQLFFIYYGLPKIGIRTNPYACGVAGLAFLGGSYMTEAFRSGIEAVDERSTDPALCHLPAGTHDQLSCLHGQCDFPAQGDKCLLGDQPDGPDVHGQGSDRTLLSDNGKPVPAGRLLSPDPAPGLRAGKHRRKEDALCRIWVLMSFLRAKTWRVSWEDWALRSKSACSP